ncbi:PREDICTED: uncharacterized protein LOC108563733 [Nicrophorus vespilloides]|uniref:Uncharacterized protein LOC108563733 n=1 Tax=Nicrophorus vespilloides TaxID=110193 RepID=A0ABM1MTS7_NICVS|nr:PREDICTED: uncharacterized protein LOC108563733 [Nicrophorus vespilloides]
MSQRENMLSAKRVREHKICDSRWLAHDKITQYKGIVKLYKGRKSTGSTAMDIEVKELSNEVQVLSNKIKTNRESLDNILSGSRHLTENVLVTHKELQLKNRGNSPLEIIESLKQNIFLNRKKIDMLHFKRKELSFRLSNLALEKAEYESYTKEHPKLPVEIECGRITGKVQDRILLTEAAISVRNTYRTMIKILQKDRIFYDQLLETLKRDQVDQSKCIFQMTVLGQLAVEQMDDDRLNFFELQKCVKESLSRRKIDLQKVHEQLNEFPKNMTMIVRMDEDETTYGLEIDDEFEEVKRSLKTVEKVLKTLKEAVFVNKYEKILPCLKDQLTITEKLTTIKTKNLNDTQELGKRIEHAKVNLERCKNEDNLSSFEASCKEFLGKIEVFKKKLNKCTQRKEIVGKKIIQAHLGLKSIYCLCKAINKNKSHDGKKTEINITFSAEDVDYPEKATEMVEVIINKLNMLDSLMRTHNMGITDDMQMDHYRAYSVLNQEFHEPTVNFDVNAEPMEDFDEVRTDNTVLTRHEIKEMSRLMVQKNKEEQLF